MLMALWETSGSGLNMLHLYAVPGSLASSLRQANSSYNLLGRANAMDRYAVGEESAHLSATYSTLVTYGGLCNEEAGRAAKRC